jgi:hypothetical protein
MLRFKFEIQSAGPGPRPSNSFMHILRSAPAFLLTFAISKYGQEDKRCRKKRTKEAKKRRGRT